MFFILLQLVPFGDSALVSVSGFILVKHFSKATQVESGRGEWLVYAVMMGGCLVSAWSSQWPVLGPGSPVAALWPGAHLPPNLQQMRWVSPVQCGLWTISLVTTCLSFPNWQIMFFVTLSTKVSQIDDNLWYQIFAQCLMLLWGMFKEYWNMASKNLVIQSNGWWLIFCNLEVL